MLEKFKQGDKKRYDKIITIDDIAAFESGTVHDVYSTFALTRDAEWSGRLFVLEMKEADEEGIGTRVNVTHCSPAFIGDTVVFEATYEEITGRHEIVTSFQAWCGSRLIAKGLQGQKILKKEKIETLFNSFKK